MCAIAGILGLDSPATITARVQRMVAAQRHRGPDGQNTVAIRSAGDRHLVLGHARLSILDLTQNASQPMHDAASGSWLAYNGEIYNFQALRRELESLGHELRSTGDTEVVLRALLQWRGDAMRRLRGMYAFAFWDGRDKQLLLGRDPFGIKPLLRANHGGTVLFASEVRGIEAAGLLSSTPSAAGIQSYLAFGHVAEPCSVLQGVEALPPGHLVVIDGDGREVSARAVMSLEGTFQQTGTLRLPFRDAVERCSSVLSRSVQEQLISDVPVGIFLSGGIDSSLVAGLAASAGVSKDVTHLTVAFPEPEYSELDAAREIAARVPGRHEVIQLEAAQLHAMLPDALAAMDQPTVDGINTFIVSRLAAQRGLKVVLSGLGGDELFGGYTTFWKAPLIARHAKLLARAARLAPSRLFGPSERAKLADVDSSLDLRQAYLLQRSIRWREWSAGLEDALPVSSPLSASRASSILGHDAFRSVSYLESSFYMRNQLLRDGDIFSAANSIELRVPLLDLEALQLAWSLPGSFHRNMLVGGKRILKSILRGLFPSRAIRRQKKGFSLPWQLWLRDKQFLDTVGDVIHTTRLYDGLPIAPETGRRDFETFARGEVTVSWAQVWSLFVLLKWIDRPRSHLAAA